MAGSVDWDNVIRVDDSEQSPEVEFLEVPELTDEIIDSIERTEEPAEETPKYEPGTQQECPTCGKSVRVRKDGTLGLHKCEPKPNRGERFLGISNTRPVTPKKVRQFSIAIVATGVESGTAYLLARPFGVEPEQVPTDLPDAEEMIGPLMDVVWPQIPKGAQNFLSTCADNSDLIACFLAWADWAKTLNSWVQEQRAFQKRLLNERNSSGTFDTTGTVDGFSGRVVPFSPA